KFVGPDCSYFPLDLPRPVGVTSRRQYLTSRIRVSPPRSAPACSSSPELIIGESIPKHWFRFRATNTPTPSRKEIEMIRCSQIESAVFLFLLLASIPAYAQTDRAHQLSSQASSQAAANCGGVTAVADCHPVKPTGCTNSVHPRYDAYLNFLKNQQPDRSIAPTRSLDINDFISLEEKVPTDIGRTHHAQFADQLADLGEGNIHSVMGYLYFVEDTAVTSRHSGGTCNWQLRRHNSFDFHLGSGFFPTLCP